MFNVIYVPPSVEFRCTWEEAKWHIKNSIYYVIGDRVWIIVENIKLILDLPTTSVAVFDEFIL